MSRPDLDPAKSQLFAGHCRTTKLTFCWLRGKGRKTTKQNVRVGFVWQRYVFGLLCPKGRSPNQYPFAPIGCRLLLAFRTATQKNYGKGEKYENGRCLRESKAMSTSTHFVQTNINIITNATQRLTRQKKHPLPPGNVLRTQGFRSKVRRPRRCHCPGVRLGSFHQHPLAPDNKLQKTLEFGGCPLGFCPTSSLGNSRLMPATHMSRDQHYLLAREPMSEGSI